EAAEDEDDAERRRAEEEDDSRRRGDRRRERRQGHRREGTPRRCPEAACRLLGPRVEPLPHPSDRADDEGVVEEDERRDDRGERPVETEEPERPALDEEGAE